MPDGALSDFPPEQAPAAVVLFRSGLRLRVILDGAALAKGTRAGRPREVKVAAYLLRAAQAPEAAALAGVGRTAHSFTSSKLKPSLDFPYCLMLCKRIIAMI